MTESKKLQTVLYDYGFLYPTHGTPPPIAALEHDARFAHDMLPVLRQLRDAAAKDLRECSYQSRTALNAAIAAAAPYLQD